MALNFSKNYNAHLELFNFKTINFLNNNFRKKNKNDYKGLVKLLINSNKNMNLSLKVEKDLKLDKKIFVDFTLENRNINFLNFKNIQTHIKVFYFINK